MLEEDQTDAEAREARVASLQERLVRVAYHFVARGLFNDDRLTFAMHLARVLSRRQADAKAGAVLSRSLSLRGASTRLVQVDNEWDVFLERTPPPTGSPPQVPSWVPQEAHGAYQALADAVPTLVTTYRLSDPSLWAAWADHATPEEAWPDIGVRWSQHAFHQVLLVQALRPDRLQSAMARFASHVIGLASVEPPPTSIGELIRTETRAMEPVLFLTTPGADPTQELADLARDSVGPGSYEEVAMGQGQSDVAVRLLRECSSSGKWLCLKNLHLVVSWLPDLEKEIFSLEPHENFRLFLTSEAHGAFPSSLLEHSLKVTFEAPPGMRNNLLRTIRGWQSGAVANGPDPVKGRIRFALAWFHAILQVSQSAHAAIGM